MDLDAFVSDGCARVRRAAPQAIADAARELPWHQSKSSPDAGRQWTEPVAWLSGLTGEGPFGELVRSPGLAAALDRAYGGQWVPRGSLATFR
jgi:hypothetical protein